MCVGLQCYIVNFSHNRVLGKRGSAAIMKNNGAASVESIIAQDRALTTSESDIRWRIITCPHDRTSVYIVNSRGKTLSILDTHGSTVTLWNGGGDGRSSMETVIETNISKFAANIRWKFIQCPYKSVYPSQVYIVNVGHAKFLDTHGGAVQVWNNGKNIETVIKENTSKYASNLRWTLIPVHCI